MSSPNQPSVLCVGSNLESLCALQKLIEHNVPVMAVVTRPAGNRGSLCDYADLHPLCETHHIKTIDTLDINSPRTVQALHSCGADYLYTLGWSQLFSTEVMTSVKQYAVGSHPSLLPMGRGRAPVPWTVLEGLTDSAVSLFRMAPGADDGPILIQQPFSIPSRATATDVYNLVAEHLGQAFVALYRAQQAGEPVPSFAQEESQATYRAKRTPGDGLISFDQPAETIDCLVRAVSKPHPGAYAYYRDQKVIFWESSLEEAPRHSGRPGQILMRDESRLLVLAADQPIWLSNFEANGQRLNPQDFRIGASFGYRIDDELHQLRAEVKELRELVQQIARLQPTRGAA